MVPKFNKYQTPEDRFWPRVDKSGDCWEWMGSRGVHGHGAFKIGGKNVLVHRFSYELTHGPIPSGLVIDHMCHNPPCVNPDHLRAVTHKQNIEHQLGAHRGSKSGVRGVYATPSGTWRAEVKHHGRRFGLGSFGTMEEAEAVAIAKRNELFTCNDADRQTN